MGYGYQQYLKDHPKKQPHKTQNRSTFSAESNITETNNGERVLDISEWQGLLTNEQIKQLKKNYDFIILKHSTVQNMLIRLLKKMQHY